MKNGMPNFADVAKAYGISGYQVDNLETLKSVIEKTVKKNTPLLIDVNVIENENCYPMVSPGRSTDQMIGINTTNKV